MQIDEPSRISPLYVKNSPIVGVSSEEIIVLAEHGGVAIGPIRGCRSSVGPMDACSNQGSSAKTRSFEIPLVGSDGEISGVWCREIPFAEDVLRNARLKPKSAQAMDETAKIFVHDINNVLSVIGGGLRLLERQGDPETRLAIFERMHRAVDRGARLSRSLLDGGRSTDRAGRAYACQADLLAAVETLAHTLGTHACLQTDISSDLWQFSAEPEQLYLALLNLCRNANAAVSHGGVVSISAINIDPVAAAPEGAVVITITDNGSGMSEDVLSRAFEPYYTTKANGEGTGLGLPQVRRFVEQCGGAIRLESEVGFGTTVRMVFPRVFSAVGEDPATTAADASTNVGMRRLEIGYVPSTAGGVFFLAGSGDGAN
jgi:signal transduction histidine kinase